MPVVNVGALDYRRITITDADFNASRDDDTSLNAGTVGEIAEAEVGEDSQLSSYEAVQYGAPPRTSGGGDNLGNEIHMQFQSGGSDIADNAQVAFGARLKGELGGPNITGWIDHRGQDSSDPRQRYNLFPQTPVVKAGRLLTILAKDEANALTVDLSENSGHLQIPALGGQ